jgi:alpha-tubulin suppressor-like RCC1 family protein
MVSAGKKHTLFLDSQGRIFSCGSNDNGQLGLNQRPFEQIPTLIPTFNDMAQMIAAGNYHSLILTKSGLVYSFGSNNEG